MGEVTLWLTVAKHLYPVGMGEDELWTKKLHTDFAPREGDTVHLWPEDDGSPFGVEWTVHRHYWGSDGSYSCDLTAMVVDPDAKDGTQTRPFDGSAHLYSSAWWTERDGRPEPGLRRGGWITYDEYRAQTAISDGSETG